MKGALELQATTISDGNLALHTVPPGAHDEVIANRARLLAAMDRTLDDLAVGEQVHGTRVSRVGKRDGGRGAHDPADALPATDALITSTPGIVLMSLSADCPLVCLLDPARPAIAVIHAGWRGLVAGVLKKTLRALAPDNPETVQAFLAPCAGPCCYEVGEEVASRFSDEAVVRRPGRPQPHLDLPEAVSLSLGQKVVRLDESCTICNPAYFSHRRAATPNRQALLATLQKL